MTTRVDERMLTVKQVAEKWGMSPAYIYKVINRQHQPLPAQRLGRSIRIPENAAHAWYEEEAS